MKKTKLENFGFTLLEVLIAFGYLAIVVATFLPLLSWLISRSRASAYDAAASLVLQEGMEVGYNVLTGEFDADWLRYPEGVYHPAVDMTVSPEVWTLLPDEQIGVEARYDRRIEITGVCRDQVTGERLTGECLINSPTRDNNSKVLKTTVEWREQGRDKSVSAELLVTNLGI